MEITQFKKKIVKQFDYQGNSVINYPQLKYKFTRIHEPKHLHPERNYSNKYSLIIEEYQIIILKNHIILLMIVITDLFTDCIKRNK